MEKGVLIYERFCGNANGRDPRLLDLLEIEFLVPQPHAFQMENHRIDPRLRWTFRGSLPWQKLLPHVERVNGPLWANVGSSRNGHNDMIPAERAPELKSSLKLVQPDELALTVAMERSASGEMKRKIRGEFELSDASYILSVTDCRIEEALQTCSPGVQKLYPKPMLCLSLSEVVPQKNACYKLIAGVIPTYM